MRRLIYGLICGGLLAVGIAGYGQEGRKRPDFSDYLRDDAPKSPPRERVYPPEWYAAAAPGETMFAPRAGSPVTGSFERWEPYAGQQIGKTPALFETRYNVWRDDAGRLRVDLLPQPVPPGIMEEDFRRPGPTTVLVMDPVSRCSFLWSEGYKADKIAHVSCMRKDTAFTALPPWDADGQEEVAYRKLHPEAKFVNEPIGEKRIEELKCLGYKHYEVGKDADGREKRTYWGERWFSPDLGEMMKSTLPERGVRVPKEYTDFQLQIAARTEPDAALFYPPAGYEIKMETAASGKKP